MKKLDWNKLITKERYKAQSYNPETDARSEFERDIDRIIFSSAFRRLKDKTQVFPVPKSDFVHNRLTHSIEVSSIGRSLGKLCGNFILNEKKEGIHNDILPSDFGDIIAAACLAHDIGNPPFGHSGEQSFRLYFKDFFEKEINKDFLDKESGLSKKQIKDFLEFEGNAEGLRILTNDHPSNREGGLRLTYTVLGSFTKYPKESIVNQNDLAKKIEKRRSGKKVGVFQSERTVFREIAEKLGLLKLSSEDHYWCRHPLSFIVEAADNISYNVMDLEDGHKLGLISTEEVVNLLSPIADSLPGDPCPKDEFDKIDNPDEKVGAYRAKAINVLIFKAFEAFKKNYEMIMIAEFDSELTDVFECHSKFEAISDRVKEFFQLDKVVEIEFAGKHIVSGLLDIYVDAYRNMKEKYAENLIKNLPKQYQFDSSTPKYDVLLRISTYISRMTDSFALERYRKLTGHKLPEII